MIKLENISKSYNQQVVLDNINLTIETCGLYGIVGESGCGKSTLLNIIQGNESYDSGSKHIDGNIAMIYQDYQLIPTLNVEENILLYRKKRRSFDSIVTHLGLSDYLSSYPKELSVGQRQRIGIARALLFDPTIILCDEPLESLDIKNRKIVMDYLKTLSQTKIILIVSHDMEMIQKYCDAIYRINNSHLYLEQINKTNSNVPNIKKPKAIQYKKVIHHLTVKYISLVTIAMTLLTIGLIVILGLSESRYHINDNATSLDKNIVYIESSSIDEINSNPYLSNTKKIINFTELLKNNRVYDCNVIPYNQSNDYNELQPPKGFELIINSNLANQLELTVGDTVTLAYNIIDVIQEEVDFTVKDIIDEDISYNNAYYNLDDMYSYLESKVMMTQTNTSVIQQSEAVELNYLSMLLKNDIYYQANIDYSNIESIYTIAKQYTNSTINSPFYEEQLIIEQNNNQLLQTTYLIVGIFMTVVCLGILLSWYLINKSLLKSYSLLANFNVAITNIKRYDRLHKLLIPIAIYVIAIGLTLLITKFMNLFLYSDYIRFIVISIVIALAYIFGSGLSIKELKQGNILSIYKDE